MNWREIEAELVEIAKHEGLWIEQDASGDSCATPGDSINLSDWAKALADRLNAKVTKVRA